MPPMEIKARDITLTIYLTYYAGGNKSDQQTDQVVVELNTYDKNVQFYVPRRYCYNTIDTDGHGIMIGYDLVGSDTHIVFSKVSGITVEIDDWSASSEILTDEKMIRKGIIEGNFRRLIKSWIRLASSSRNGVAVLAGEVKP